MFSFKYAVILGSGQIIAGFCTFQLADLYCNMLTNQGHRNLQIIDEANGLQPYIPNPARG